MRAAVCLCVSSFGQLNAPPGPFIAVVAGSKHACALLMADLNIVCWGANDVGQAPRLPVSGPFASLSAGATFTCALRYADGTLVCWGIDSNGLHVPAAGVFMSLSTGGGIACAVRRTDFSMACWGQSGFVSPFLPFGSPHVRTFTLLMVDMVLGVLVLRT
jgi:hypothetical protein